MLIIGIVLALLFSVLIGVPLGRRISRPLENTHPVLARIVRSTMWLAIATLVTWQVAAGPLLFKLKCKTFTRLDVEPAIDARTDGYLDERLNLSANIQTHFDTFYLDKDVDDLVSGRISFFEKHQPFPSASRPYLRYSLIDAGSPNCAPKVVGGGFGRSKLAQTAPTKCLGVEQSQTAISRFAISASGDPNIGDGTTKIVERRSNKVVAMFRSFSFGFVYSGTDVCPNLRIEGDDYGGHVIFTKMVFKDAAGKVEKAIQR